MTVKRPNLLQPVQRSLSLREQWKVKTKALYRVASETRRYEALRSLLLAMFDGYNVYLIPGEDPLFAGIAKFLKSFALSITDRDYTARETTLLLYLIGDLLCDCREFDIAHYCLDKAIQMDPNSEGPYFAKAKACKGTGDTERAIEQCEKILSLNPARVSAYMIVGHLYRQCGRFGKAKQYYEKYLLFADENDSEETAYCTAALKWINCLNRKIELFGEELKFT